jgi:phosphoribosylanthranilate isomerase
MTWVKICGITNLEDAMTAVEAGADALGFVFYEKSPRRLDVETAREIVARVPEGVEKFGVFVDGSPEQIRELADQVGLTALQLHRTGISAKQGTVRDVRSFSSRKIFSVWPVPLLFDEEGRFEGVMWFQETGSEIDGIFLDSGNSKTPGGTGRVFDWTKIASDLLWLTKTFKVVVAGGLNSSNVADAMRILCPWGVDVASGVEARPGKKDPEKVKAFIAAVRAADNVH